jgi:hypothetical protein
VTKGISPVAPITLNFPLYRDSHHIRKKLSHRHKKQNSPFFDGLTGVSAACDGLVTARFPWIHRHTSDVTVGI